MATSYWVGGNGLFTDGTMWANTSGGTGGSGSVPTTADTAIFDKAATYTVTGNVAALILTVSAGLVTFNAAAVNIGATGAGSLTFGTGNVAAFTFSSSFTFSTTTTLTIDTKGVPLNGSGIQVIFGISGRTGTISLLSDLTITGGVTPTNGKVALNYGSFDLNNFKLSTDGPFFINNALAHTLAFGTNGTGNITVTGVDTNLVAFSLAGTITITGVPIVNISYSNPSAQTVNVYTLAATEANSISFNFTTGTYNLNFLSTAGYSARSVSFAGFAGTWTRTTTATIYGDLTLSAETNFSVAATTAILTLGSTNATTTRVITSYGKTLDVPITIGTGSAGLFQLADALTMGASRTLTLSFGALNLNNQTLTAGFFSSSSSNGRSLAFGSSGRIRLIGAGGTLWNTATLTNFTTSGTSDVTIDNNSAVATTITPSSLSETQALSFNIISGNYTLTVTNTAAFKNLNFVANPSVATTGFAGSIASHTADISIFGNLTLSSSMSATLTSSPGFIFKATSGTQILTSNGRTFDSPMAQNGSINGTLQLADAFAMGSTRTFNFNNGTFDGNNQLMTGALALSASASGTVAIKGLNTAIVFNHTASSLTAIGPNTTGKLTTISGTMDLNGYTWTASGFGTGVGTKTLTFNGGTLLLTGPFAPTMDNANPTGFTTVAGIGTGYIRMNAAAAKTFSGGGSIFNCILSNDGAGALTITGFNTFLGITNGVSPTSFVFPAGVSANITTVSNFSINGASSTSLVTITSATAGSPATLSMASGTVSANYLSLKDSAATGGASWKAVNSQDVSGNSGWSFSNIVATANFFLVF